MPLTEEEVDQVKQLVAEALHPKALGAGPAGGFINDLIMSQLKTIVETATDPARTQQSVQNLYPQLSPQTCRELGLLISDKLRGALRPAVNAPAATGGVHIEMRS